MSVYSNGGSSAETRWKTWPRSVNYPGCWVPTRVPYSPRYERSLRTCAAVVPVDSASSRLDTTFRSSVPQLFVDIDREQVKAMQVPIQEVFDDVGVPKRVNLLVEGESLFADSTALVAYVLLLSVLTGQAEFTVASGILAFIEASAGGIVLGYLFARFTCWLFTLVKDSQIAKNTLAVCLAYVCFFLVDDYLGYSGVMAVVTAALVVGSHGRAVYSPSNWQGFLGLAGQINFISKSLIFILVGVVAPSLMQGFGWFELKMLVILLIASAGAYGRAMSSRYNLREPAGEHVLQHPQVGNQVQVLVDEADPAAQPAQFTIFPSK